MRIVSWNVNGLYPTLKDASVRYSSASNYFSEILKADIVCFQEAKIQEDKLEKWMACVPGYESFWAFSKEKKGYSGVVTYVKEKLSPLDAKADCLVDCDDPLIEELSSEGRLVETDHGSFVLINVYAPNAGDREQGVPRIGFKLRFLEALRRKCDELVCLGRHVMIVGDLNIPHRDIDLHKNFNIRDMYSSEEIAFMDTFLMQYVDLFRYFHPDVEDVFSVWDQKTDARSYNQGLRIDYAVCDKGFVSQVLCTDIVKMFPKKWSDHASVMLTLKEQPILPAHPIPVISSHNMKRFQEDHKQKKLTSLFSLPSKRQSETAKIKVASQSDIHSNLHSSGTAGKDGDSPEMYQEHVEAVQPSFLLTRNSGLIPMGSTSKAENSGMMAGDLNEIKEMGVMKSSVQQISGDIGVDQVGNSGAMPEAISKPVDSSGTRDGDFQLYHTESGPNKAGTSGGNSQVNSRVKPPASNLMPSSSKQSNGALVKKQKIDGSMVTASRTKGPVSKQQKTDSNSTSNSAIPSSQIKQRSLTSYFLKGPD